MDNEKKAEIDKLGLQEFPHKTRKFERPIPLPEQIERISTPEALGLEKEKARIERQIMREGGSRGELGGIVAQGQASMAYSQREKEIDKILSDGLEEIYMSMSSAKQEEFKQVGEETAREINSVLSQTKFAVKTIIDLIRSWLAIIPGVNKFFLEQETKIRTDKILNLKKD
ncbi:MAG: hypothetical protein Q7T50_00715 [Candidatus Magasanikbacteria bacterium]|nr:hypothetical protein [Candidatus Magasanikbacteria bacterium]